MQEKNLFTGYVYRYTCPSGKFYIGQTRQDITKRAGYGGRYYKSSSYFYNAIQKYGLESFTIDILHRVKSKDREKLVEKLNTLEVKEVKSHRSNDKAFGYNINSGGTSYIAPKGSRNGLKNSMYGKKHNAETIRLLSKLRKEWFTERPGIHCGANNPTYNKRINVGNKNGMYGKKPANYKNIDERVIKMYKTEKNMSKIARSLEVTPSCIRQKLIKAGEI
jgi:group I intron endonuclease